MSNLNIKPIQFTDVERLLRNKEISYFNIYNGDISPSTYFSSKYYFNHKYDTIDIPQKIRTVFIDIELYVADNIKSDLDLTKAEIPINAVTIIDSFTNEIESFYLLNNNNYELFGIKNDSNFNINQFIINKQTEIINYLIETKYLDSSMSLKLSLFNDEKELLKSLWMKIHNYDPDVLSGWNIDYFDIPYVFNRLVNLFGLLDTNRLMSKFGNITVKNDMVSIPEYTIVDLLYLYKPRDEGGLIYN